MISTKTFLISCLLLLLSIFIVVKFVAREEVEVVQLNLDRFPYEIGEFKGNDVPMSSRVVDELNTDVYVYRNYTNDQWQTINLYIGYYGTAKGGRTGHNPNACYPSSGYGILAEDDVDITVLLDGETQYINVTRLKISKGDELQIVYHWYQSAANKILSSGIALNINRFNNLLLYNRNDGAFVRVSTIIKGDQDEDDKELVSFIKKILPLIEEFWPIENEKKH